MRERSQKMKPTNQKSPESRDNKERKIENNCQQGIFHTKTLLRAATALAAKSTRVSRGTG